MLIFPEHLKSLTDAGWCFRQTSEHDGKDLYLQIEAKSPKPLLSDWFEVAESRHASHAELVSHLTVEMCVKRESFVYAAAYWLKHKYSIEDAIKRAIEKGESSVTFNF